MLFVLYFLICWLAANWLWSMLEQYIVSYDYRDTRHEQVVRAVFTSVVMCCLLSNLMLMFGMPLLLVIMLLNWVCTVRIHR
jgi:hypothetical protein